MEKVIVALLISICLLFPMKTHAQPMTSESCTKERSGDYLVLDWRQNKVTDSEIDELTNKKYKDWNRWQEFIKVYYENKKDSDIWYYCSPVKTWESLMGREGYAVFTGDLLIECIVVQMN